MSRPTTIQGWTVAFTCCLPLLCQSADNSVALKTNPFVKPVLEIKAPTQASASVDKPALTKLELRGTVVAGQASLANVGGVILSIGEEVEGYTLVSVEQRQVVLQKGGSSRTLSVDDTETGTRQ